MLSRVLKAGDGARALPFQLREAVAPVIESRPGAPGHRPERDDAEAIATIQRLEAELAMARKQAFEAGRIEGEQRARAEFEPVAAKMNASIVELATLRSEMRRRAERDVVQLALLIAKRVLHRELNVDESALAALARVAFDRLSRAESYKITVHPRFAKIVSASLPPAIASKVRIEPDPACELGTLVIDAPEGRIDASIDTQLEEIGRGLTDRLTRP